MIRYDMNLKLYIIYYDIIWYDMIWYNIRSDKIHLHHIIRKYCILDPELQQLSQTMSAPHSAEWLHLEPIPPPELSDIYWGAICLKFFRFPVSTKSPLFEAILFPLRRAVSVSQTLWYWRIARSRIVGAIEKHFGAVRLQPIGHWHHSHQIAPTNHRASNLRSASSTASTPCVPSTGADFISNREPRKT